MTGDMPKTLHDGWQAYRDGPLQDVPQADIALYCATYLDGVTMAFHRMVNLFSDPDGAPPHAKECFRTLLKELLAAVAACKAAGECDVAVDAIQDDFDKPTH
jgi:hypothetical protein